MAKISLKNIISPKTELFSLLGLMTADLKATLLIEDQHNKILFGTAGVTFAEREPILHEEEVIGWVHGNNHVSMVAGWLNVFVKKEAEKKRLGNEVLTLYQEVNLIFNFSERLAQTIGQNNISEIALEEARRLIRSEYGMVVLWDEETSQLDLLASSGQPVFELEKFKSNPDILLATLQKGQSDIISDPEPLKKAGLLLPEVQSLIYAALKVNHRIMGAIILASVTPVQYAAADLKYLITIALQSSAAIESALLYEENIREAKEREDAMRRIYDATNKFVPHEFIKSLGRNVITDVQLGDQVEKIVTVLFSDIRGYTTLAEQMTPEENFRFVCSFNERMGPIIREHNGFINQYLGDAIMAIFPGNAGDALSAAIKMQQAVRDLNEVRILNNKLPIKIGVGMHTGPLIMGITGDHERMDASTIADTVNIASRLESLTKYYKVNILLSEDSVNNLIDESPFHYRHMGWIQLKGKHTPVSIYECFNDMGDSDIRKKLEALPIYKQGMMEYFSRSFKTATDKFSQVLEIHPEDTTTKLFLGKSRQYLDQGTPENWTGVEEMEYK